MKFTIAPVIIQLSVGSVNKNFHYASRGGALVQITPKFSSDILLLFSPHYNNIIPKQQELVKEYYRELVGIPSNYMKFPRTWTLLQMLRHWNPVSLTLRPQIAYSHWLKMRPQRDKCHWSKISPQVLLKISTFCELLFDF